MGELLNVITKRYNVDVYEASWILFREWLWGRIRFTPRAGLSSFLTADAMGYWLIVLIMVLAPALISINNALVLPIRVILGVLAYIYLPGYSILMMMYPTGSPLKPVETLLASVAVSLSIIGLIALALSLTIPVPLAVLVGPIAYTVSVLTVVFATIAYVRRFRLSTCHRYG